MKVHAHACKAYANEMLPFLPLHLHNQELMPECECFVGGVVALRLPCNTMTQCIGVAAQPPILVSIVLRVTLKLEPFRR
jgi:hypothetical protein